MNPTDDAERIERLRSAKSMLDEAADVIEECIRMTDFDQRFGNLPEDIRTITGSKEGNSLGNLINELEYASEEQPGWTRPLASVKNCNRKDI